FLSYSRIDCKIADEIAKVLSELHVSCFLDVKDLAPGEDFEAKVMAELSECAAVLVVISPASLQSTWVSYELGYARGWRKQILPLVTKPEPDLTLPIYLSRLHHLTSVESVREFFMRWNPPILQHPIFLAMEKPPDALIGKWSGTGHQQRGPHNRPINWNLTLRLRPNGNQVEGEMLMHGVARGEHYRVD